MTTPGSQIVWKAYPSAAAMLQTMADMLPARIAGIHFEFI